tara:strand:+ start:4061 stop:5872 length:1812 start_codon:yes stop_codon:yes gene_type:complete
MNGHESITLKDILTEDNLATQIANMQQQWRVQRHNKVNEWQELRNYLFATDTSTTSNSTLPWTNTTTIPKLCQIRDTLHALYMAILFPKKNWLSWEASNSDSASKEVRNVIKSYMYDKLRVSKFRITMSKVVLDYIDYGNCFATVDYVKETQTDPETQQELVTYVGPRLVRISPLDIVFNPVSRDFKSSPKIIRSLVTIADLHKRVKEQTGLEEANGLVSYLAKVRERVRAQAGDRKFEDNVRDSAYIADGFGSIQQYYGQDLVEILEFYGDIYDYDNNILKENRKIVIADGHKLISDEEIKSTNPEGVIFHAGWRERPDNLWAMGPLDNLVGMQYRIDHLENIKADVFDLIAFPVVKVRGFVHDFNWQPLEKIITGDDGDVEVLAPDARALDADFQIANLERKMEEMAGVPREALGFRTPGEKTAFEIQRLENASLRLFQNKTEHFEEAFLESLLNHMLIISKQNLDEVDTIRILDDELSIELFETIRPQDLTGSGRILPVGARNFKEKAEVIQNITNAYASGLFQDPQVSAHLSGKKLAQLIEEVLDLSDYNLFSENIRVAEELETQQAAQSASELFQSEVPVGGSVFPEDDPTLEPDEEV